MSHLASFCFLAALVLLSGCNTIELSEPLVPRAVTLAAPVPPLTQAWEQNVQGGFGPDAPVLAGGLLIVGTRNGELRLLDALDGSPKGLARIGESINGQPAVSADGRVVYVPLADRGVVAFGLLTGRAVWRWREGKVSAGLAATDGIVVAATRDGRVVGLDASTGEERWTVSHASPNANAQFQATPVVLPTGILVSDDSGTVRLLDIATGTVVWSVSVGEPVYRTPAFADGIVAVPTTRGSLVALDARTGARLWHASIGVEGRTRVGAPAFGRGGTLFLGASDGVVRAYDGRTGRLIWTHQDDAAISAAPLPVGDVVYVGTLGRSLIALGADDGTVRWGSEVRGRIKSALVYTGINLIALTEPSHVVAFEAAHTANR